MKLQQNIGRKINNAFAKKANKISLSVSDSKRISYKNDKLNKMINFNDATGENRQEHNLHWLQILDNLYRTL